MRHSSSLTALDSMENAYAAPLVELEPLAAPPNEAAVRARMRAEARASARARPGPSGGRAAPRRAPERDEAPPLVAPQAPLSVSLARPAAAAGGARRGPGSRAGSGSGPGLQASPSGRLSLDGGMQRVTEEEELCESSGAAASSADGGAGNYAAGAPAEWNAPSSSTGADVPPEDPAVAKGGGGAASVAVEASAGTAEGAEVSALDPDPDPDSQGPGRLRAVREEVSAAASSIPSASDGDRDGPALRVRPPESPVGVPEAASSAPAELLPSVAELSSPEGRAKPVRHLVLYICDMWRAPAKAVRLPPKIGCGSMSGAYAEIGVRHQSVNMKCHHLA